MGGHEQVWKRKGQERAVGIYLREGAKALAGSLGTGARAAGKGRALAVRVTWVSGERR